MKSIFRTNGLTKSDFYFQEPNGTNDPGTGMKGDYNFAKTERNEEKRNGPE